MSASSPRPLTPPEASVLGDALQHGVVKVGRWRLRNRPVIGAERAEAANRLSEAGLLYLAGERPANGAALASEEYLPTPRSRGRSRRG